MTPAQAFESAGIRRVAFVDDDFSAGITLGQLEEYDRHTASTLHDRADPDCAALVELLEQERKPAADEDNLLQAFNDPELRDKLPDRYRVCIDGLFVARASRREEIDAVRTLLVEHFGIQEASISTFDSAESFTQSTDFDLLIVDYYLQGISKEGTVEFLEKCVGDSKDAERPLLLVLASTYGVSIRNHFRELRQRLGITTSRFRILQKPDSPSLLHMWKRSLMLLAADRSLVVPIENLVGQMGETVKQAAEQLAKELWELDAHALGALHRVAEEDHDDFGRYLDECLSRRLLGFLEQNTELRSAARALTVALRGASDGRSRREAVEAGDSRRALLELLDDIAWRRAPAWQADEFADDVTWDAPRRLTELSDWFVRNVRFGAVLRDRSGELWLNLTQACDILQSKPSQRASEVLLLVHGSRTPSIHNETRRALARSDGFYHDGARGSVWWNVRRAQSPVINTFISNFNADGWSLAGEMRQDQAQHVLNLYASLASRVALPNLPRTWRVVGRALTLFEILDGAEDSVVGGCEVAGDAVREFDIAWQGEKEKKREWARLYLSFPEVERIKEHYPAFAQDDFDRFFDGVEVGLDTFKEKGASKPRVVYFAKPDPTFGELRKAFIDEKTKRLADPTKRREADNELWVVLSPDFR